MMGRMGDELVASGQAYECAAKLPQRYPKMMLYF